MAWTVTVEGRNNKGTATLSWSDPEDPAAVFTISREGEYSAEALAAMLPVAIAERDRWLASRSRKALVASEIAAALNAADPGPPE